MIWCLASQFSLVKFPFIGLFIGFPFSLLVGFGIYSEFMLNFNFLYFAWLFGNNLVPGNSGLRNRCGAEYFGPYISLATGRIIFLLDFRVVNFLLRNGRGEVPKGCEVMAY